MKKIDLRFLAMGIFFLLYGLVRKSPFILVVGGAFLVYSFYSLNCQNKCTFSS